MTRRVLSLVLLCLPTLLTAAEPLHRQIDAAIMAKGKGKPVSALADDAEFLRRITLDLTGRIPTIQETRAFLQDASADKRTKLIDRLIASPDHPRRMADMFNLMLMERLGDNADWTRWLQTSFEKNRPWDAMSREILSASREEQAKGAAFFLSKRLENYGQNPVDYPALTRDIGRLFLGANFQCAQCHDHLFINDYKQADFQGLFAFVQNVAGGKAGVPNVVEKPTMKKVGFASVFEKVQKETGPRVPGMKEIPLPTFKPGEEWQTKPDPKAGTPGKLKFSTLSSLAEQVTDPANQNFSRNFVNRLWYLMMGRGLVHPLDLHHADNPPSHPELLDLLAKEAVARKYDIRSLLREIVMTETYQRSSILPQGVARVEPTFLTAYEKRMSAEQLLASVLEATGERDRIAKSKGGIEAMRTKFQKAFANPAREPEEEFAPSLRSALLLLNDVAVLEMLEARPGNLVDRAAKLSDERAAEELYLCILSRKPTAEELEEVKKHLAKNAARRSVAVGQLAWALLASTEFCVNH